MKFTEVMSELERLGTEQNRVTYRRHGAGDALFGVSFAHLYTLQKRLKKDQALAESLWATGNADARLLATMIAEPARFTADLAEAWLDGVRYSVLIDLVVKNVAAKTPFARELAARWTASEDEWIGRAGWSLMGDLAANDAALADEVLERSLERIEASIHRAKNRTREAMNMALINIGARNMMLRGKALQAAKRIGKVDVDQGDTACKTPDASAYIDKMWARKPPAGKEKASDRKRGVKKAAGTGKEKGKEKAAGQAKGGARPARS